jgi:hypothetical protein
MTIFAIMQSSYFEPFSFCLNLFTKKSKKFESFTFKSNFTIYKHFIQQSIEKSTTLNGTILTRVF